MLGSILKKVRYNYANSPIVVKASIWYFICSFLQKGISVISTPIFTRLLSTYEYGKYTLYIAWSDFLGIFITFGLASSVYQKKLIELDSEVEKDRLTSALLFLAILLAGASFCIYIFFQNTINSLVNLDFKFIIAIYISTVMTTAFNFWAMRQRVNYKYRKLIYVTLVITVFKPLFGIISILKFPNHKIEARIFSLVAVEFIGYCFLLFAQLRKGKHFINKDYWKYALGYVLPLIPHFLSQRVLNQSDRVMIESMVSTSAAGIYGLAYSAGSILNMLITPSEGTLAPWIYTKIKNKHFSRIYEVTKYPIMAVGGICAVFMTVSPELIKLFAPMDYYEGIRLMPAFITITYFMLIYTLFIFFEYYFEKTKFIMIATALSAILNIILNYVFITTFGYAAAAYTSLACYIIYTYAHYIVLKKICKEKKINDKVYNIKLISLIGTVLVVYGVILQFLYNNIIFRYFVVFLAGVFMYFKRAYVVEKIKIFKN